MQWWKYVAILIAGVAIGIYGQQQYGFLRQEMTFSYVTAGTTLGHQLACKAVAYAVVHDADNAFSDSRRVKAYSAQGTDQLALQISETEVAVFTALSVSLGDAKPDKHAIIQGDDPQLIVARRTGGTVMSAIVIDKETGNGLWVKTAKVLGRLMGQAHYLACR